MKSRYLLAAIILAALLSTMGGPSSALFAGLSAGVLAASAPPLGSAESFAVLGGSTVTNTGPTTISGDLGVSPGTAVTGFPPGIVTGGGIHAADAVALQAQSDVTTAYNNLAGQACGDNLTGQDLGGQTLTPDVYCFDDSAQLTGALTLDFGGDSNAVFVFRIGSPLTTASNSSVSMINSPDACNVFWQVGSSATLGTDTDFVGSILALTSITLNTGASIDGRALARNGAVTMDSNRVSNVCFSAPAPTAVPTADATAVPTVDATGTALPAETFPAPTTAPTAGPTSAPTGAPTSEPTAESTAEPTSEPTAEQTSAPTSEPPAEPTSEPTAGPTSAPTAEPTAGADQRSDHGAVRGLRGRCRPDSDPRSDSRSDSRQCSGHRRCRCSAR